jgi:phenylacetate-coenzyme A ligase PaaK-like adenylate-forming protein
VRYLASEALALTSRCRQGQFHVNADWYIVEPVDKAFQPVPAGELSHTVLVTNLANQVQPLIRYNLGDRVQMLAGPCACGSPFPALRVEGRSGDVLTFAAEDGRTVTVLPLALGTVIEETAGVRRFQARALPGGHDGGRADRGTGTVGCVLRRPGRRRRGGPVRR